MRKVFATKDRVESVEVGEVIGIGYPYLHNVYQVMEEDRLKFIYHYTKEKVCECGNSFL